MLKEKIKTAVQFTKSLRTSGALYETSRKVEIEITSKISSDPNKVYVEFGLGHGNITKEILHKIHSTSKLYSFEVNPDFIEHVNLSIDDDRLIIINDSAELINTFVNHKVDGIVSSIPFTLIPKKARINILNEAFIALKEGSYFSQVLYSKLFKKTLSKVFDTIQIKKIVNLPIEYIHHCKKSTFTPES